MILKDNFIGIPLDEYKRLIELETRVQVFAELLKRGQVEDKFDALDYLGMPEEANECRDAHEKRMKEIDESLKRWAEERKKEKKNEMDG